MKNKQRISYLIVLVSLLTVACMPTWTGQKVASNPGDVDTGQIVQTVLTQVEAELAAQRSTIPTAYQSAALSGDQVTGLEDTLVRLYRYANPSVVYIIVSSTSSGSGFVYDRDGHIVTNHHVVSGGRSYEVVFADGERRRATLIGSDADSDLAVLKVDALPDGVEPLPLGDEASIQVGQLVVAIGNPFGEQGSMSLGIVSGLGRSLPSQRSALGGSTYSLPQVIQTDAPINPGNSGGPLINLNGQVIGVSAAIASTTGTNSGVGFAIPVSAVKRVVPALIEQGRYTYPYIGASFDGEISLDEQSVYGVEQTQGAYVVSVMPNSPASRAGLVAANAQTGRGGDLVIEIDGQPVKNFADLNAYLVFHTQVGQTVTLTVLRDGKPVHVQLTLGARP